MALSVTIRSLARQKRVPTAPTTSTGVLGLEGHRRDNDFQTRCVCFYTRSVQIPQFVPATGSHRFYAKKALQRPRLQLTKEQQSEKSKDIERMHIKEGLEAFRQEYRREILEHGDVIDEPNMSSFDGAFDTYLEEAERLKTRIKRKKMAKKHFRDLLPREPSLLTWAEKENIRYLLEVDPDQWTPETIAQAYPISPDGVKKLLKSSMKLKTPKDVIRHDTTVAEKINRLKSGEEPMTEELEERLKIRDLIPIRVGDLGINADQFVDLRPKTDGPFARLVAPPSEKEKPIRDDKNQSVAYITDGSYYYDENEIKKERKQELTKDELREIVRIGKRMTFDEFENSMQRAKPDTLSEDMKYMLNLENNEVTESRREQQNYDESSEEEYRNPYPVKTTKFKSLDEAGTISLTVEGEQSYLFENKTGYQKPYGDNRSEISERIEIPEEHRTPGAIYKLGDCYYDENGEFLYRVL